MEFFQVFSFLLIVYAFISFLPEKGRFVASIPVILLISFSYRRITHSFIKLYSSDIFYVQMLVCFSLAFLVERSLSSITLKSQGALEFSQFLDFFKILTRSIKLVPENGKLLGLVAALSLLVPSFLFSLFTFLYQFLLNRCVSNLSHLILLLLVEFAFLLACSVIFELSSIATTLISAAAYYSENMDKLSSSDLFSRMKTTWRRQLSNSFSRSRNPTRFELVNGPISNVICVAAIVNISPSFCLLFLMDHESAVRPLSSVVSVIEESSDGGEAQKKAGHLVEGQRVHGFMVKLLYLMTAVYSWILGDAGSEIHLSRGLLLLSLLSLGRMMWRILHVVLYFRCKKEKGEAKMIDALPIGKQSQGSQ